MVREKADQSSECTIAVKRAAGAAPVADIPQAHPATQCSNFSMRRFILAEPVGMPATVLQWLVLSIITGALIGVGCTMATLAAVRGVRPFSSSLRSVAACPLTRLAPAAGGR
jgi:hypothetical protein